MVRREKPEGTRADRQIAEKKTAGALVHRGDAHRYRRRLAERSGARRRQEAPPVWRLREEGTWQREDSERKCAAKAKQIVDPAAVSESKVRLSCRLVQLAADKERARLRPSNFRAHRK